MEFKDQYIKSKTGMVVLAVTLSAAIIGSAAVTYLSVQYKFVRQLDLNHLAGYDIGPVLKQSQTVYPEIVLETVTDLADPHFSHHSGFFFMDDVRSLLQGIIHQRKQAGTINRHISGQLLKDNMKPGLRYSLYKDYLLPVRLHRELSKSELGVWYVTILQEATASDLSRLHYSIFRKRFDQADHFEVFFTLALAFSGGHQMNDPELLDLQFRHLVNSFYRNAPEKTGILDRVKTRYHIEFPHFLTIALTHSRTAINKAGFGGAIYYRGDVLKAAEKHGVEFPLLLAVVQAESNGKPDVISRAGAIGIAQIMPATARDVLAFPELHESQLYDVELNLDIAARYLKTIEGWVGDAYPNLDDAEKIEFIAASYNAGWSRVRRANGVPAIRETRQYVKRVTRYYQLYTEHENLLR